jgi:gluconolactonase
MEDARLFASGLAFPEGPVLLDDGALLVTELGRGALTRVDPDGSIEVVVEIGGGPNGIAVGPDGAWYVCNNGSVIGGAGTRPAGGGGRIERVDPQTGTVELLYDACDGRRLFAPNDLVFDATGNLWFTDYGSDNGRTHERGGIFYAAPDGSMIREVVGNVEHPNGIGLSPAGDVVYWAETSTCRVWRRRISAPGELAETTGLHYVSALRGVESDRWLLLAGLPGYQPLDSLAVEADGRVCVATLLDGGITVIDPADGSHELLRPPPELADDFVTNICFGGDDMRDAYVTLSQTGRVMQCRWPRPGLRLAY